MSGVVTPPRPDVPTTPVAGVVTVRARALEQVLRAVARDALGCPSEAVQVRLSDTSGGLALHVVAPVPAPGGAGRLVPDLHRARAAIAAQFAGVAGRDVARVDLRVSGVCADVRPRVR